MNFHSPPSHVLAIRRRLWDSDGYVGSKSNKSREGYSALGHRIQDWIDAQAGRSVSELARRVGISQPALRYWLFDTSPHDPKRGAPKSLQAIVRIATELETTVERLMSGVGDLPHCPSDDEINAVWDGMSNSERRAALRRLSRSASKQKGAEDASG